jgi:hypothetical protein
MASGHVNRVKRPNTWLHRPMLQNVKKALANPEPSTHDPACVKRRRLRLAVEVGNDEAILCPDCLHQTTNAQNADYPFHIVGQDV